MNIEQAKRLNLVDVLASLGHAPSVERKAQAWYFSPFRDEQTPSFKVNLDKNLWYDFGAGQGGDVIDLIKKLERLPDVSSVLARLDELNLAPVLIATAPARTSRPSRQSEVKLKSVHAVKSPMLLRNLRERGIKPQDVKGVIQEAHYEIEGKQYHALAFANDEGGYELRNPWFKGTISPKTVTTIRGKPDTVAVFEGFFDYLTYLVTNPARPDETAVILNSVSFRDKAVDIVRQLQSRTVHLYRDNDEAGVQLLKHFTDNLKRVSVVDMAGTYREYNDLNEWHCSHKKEAQR